MAALATPWLLVIGVLAAANGAQGAAWPGDALQLLQSDVRRVASPAPADGTVPPAGGAAVELATLEDDEEHPDKKTTEKVLKELKEKREREAKEQADAKKPQPKSKAAPTSAPKPKAASTTKPVAKAAPATTTPTPKSTPRPPAGSKSAVPTLAPRSHYKTEKAYRKAQREVDKARIQESQKKKEEIRRRNEQERRDRGWSTDQTSQNLPRRRDGSIKHLDGRHTQTTPSAPATTKATAAGKETVKESTRRRRLGGEVRQKLEQSGRKSTGEPDRTLPKATIGELVPDREGWQPPRGRWLDSRPDPASAPEKAASAPAPEEAASAPEKAASAPEKAASAPKKATIRQLVHERPGWQLPREKWSDTSFDPASAPLGNTTAPVGWGPPEPQVYAGPYSNSEVVGFKYRRSMRLLVFFAAGTRHRPMRMVTRNIHHIKTFEEKSANVVFDIYMAHYDMGSHLWKQYLNQTDGSYHRNVKYSADRYGLKFPLAKELLLKPKAGEPVVNVTDYDWIWFLDEDADITQMDLRYLLKDLYDTGSLIASPSIVPAGKPFAASARRRTDGDSFDSENETYRCQPGSYDCTVQYPNQDCRFRYMNFVEVSFPLIRTDAFLAIFSSCATCMHKRSVWGLDHVWCKLAARLTTIPGYDRRLACAVLDRASVVHRNFRTLEKWNYGKEHRKLDQMDFAEVRYHMPEFWVDDVIVNTCVMPEPAIADVP